MTSLFTTLNITLFSVGITIAAIGILGFVAFFSNSRNSTNRAFLFLSILTVFYSAANYISYQLSNPSLVLWLLRITIFLAVWHAFSFFHFTYVFPKENIAYPPFYKRFLIPVVGVISLVTLSPLVFSGLKTNGAAGVVSQPIFGPAIAVFGLATFGLIIAALILLIKGSIRSQAAQKKQFIFILLGAAITFLLLIIFNLILPIVFQRVSYVPLAAIFFFPFIAFTTYAIMRHHLLSVKVVSTEVLAFVLTIVTFSDVIFSQSVTEILFRIGEFILVLSFSILLIKSVLNEVRQREELQRLNQQISAANAQLEDLSRFKSELLSLASHQIKSPLAAIKGFASLIGDGSYGEVGDKVKETLGKIKNQADGLIGLINTLLDVRKVEEGKMEYQFEKVDLAELVSQVVTSLEPLALAKNLKFDFDFQKKPIFVNADKEKLRQVIQNLTDNSIKYTPSGFVHLELKDEAGKATFSVSDSGVGIPATLIPHLFEEFVRDERVKKQILGTGLGLYIARKIVEAHAGKIWAESAGEGKGSSFRVSLPEVKAA